MRDMKAWISFLQEAAARGETAVVITVASSKGSVPREAGTKMVVTADDVHGTIGGGHLEFKAIDIARGTIAADGPRALHRFPLGATLGQCCGGVVNLLFEPVPAGAAWVDVLASRVACGKHCIVGSPVSGDIREGKIILDVVGGECEVAGGSLGQADQVRDAVAISQAMLDDDRQTTIRTLAATAATPAQTYFFDSVRESDFRIVLFGAGHVGRALVKVMSDIDCRITWVDSRETEFPRDVPANVEPVCTDAPEGEVGAAAPGSYFLVMTHSHALDQSLSQLILQRADFVYFGLIGSHSKRRQFEKRLLDRGVSEAQLARMTCPIGAAGMASKEPAAIAIAVAAELLHVHSRSKDRLPVAKPESSSAVR